MFNLSGSEIVFLLVAGLVVLGPERLPGVIRTVGRVYGDVRRAARGFEKEITETFREPIKDFKDATNDIKTGFGQIDTEPSPPMRPEMPRSMPAIGGTTVEGTTVDGTSSPEENPDTTGTPPR